MTPWIPIEAYGFPPSQEKLQGPRQGVWGYGEYCSFEKDRELERCREKERIAKEEGQSQRKVVEQVAMVQRELEGFRERQWRREEEVQGLMVGVLRERVGGEGKGGGEEKWKKELDGLRKEMEVQRRELEEQRREREVGELVARARREGRKEVEVEVAEKARKEKEREKENGWSGRYGGREWGDAGNGRGRKALEERMEDLEIFGQGFIAGRRDVGPLTASRGLLRRGGAGYGQGPRYGEDWDEDSGYGPGLPWNSNSRPLIREPVTKGDCPGAERFNDRLKGIESSQRRVEERFQIEDAKREWEKDYEQREMFRNLNETLRHFRMGIDR
ncbi:hypothetical protein EG329_012018 [Mollisiaceae sp. DMI_Dod_QoI]|nr:hypothetical protein EG329_012018 [Helotiales sp. DMI_Dod_QoI]